MSVPGSNLLNKALGAIKRQTVTYYRFNGRITNAAGLDVAAYLPPTEIVGSLQPLSRVMMANLGLDWQKSYYNFYTSNNVLDVRRDVSGDKFQFNGKLFQCESIVPWFDIDGWVSVLAVIVDDNPPDPDSYVITPGTVYIVEPQ